MSFDGALGRPQIELEVFTSALDAAFGYSPSGKAPEHHSDIHARVQREIETHFWRQVYVDRPEAREILFQTEKGQIVIIVGERGTGKSTAIEAAEQVLRGGREAVGDGTGPEPPPNMTIVRFDANRFEGEMAEPKAAAQTMCRELYALLEESIPKDEQADWSAYCYGHSRDYDELKRRVKQDGFDPHNAAEWSELLSLPDYQPALAASTHRFAEATNSARLQTLLTFIGSETVREPLLVVDNVDGLDNPVQRHCARKLFQVLGSSGWRVRAVVAIRPENRDAIREALNTARRPPEVHMLPPANDSTDYTFERPTAELTLRFIERRVAVVRKRALINAMLASIAEARARELAERASLTTSRDVDTFFSVLLELMSIMMFNVFGADERDAGREEDAIFARALRTWYNGSLRECGASLTAFASEILQDRTHMSDLRDLLRTVIDGRNTPQGARHFRLRRLSRSLLYRHLVFWGSSGGKPLRNVMVFDGKEEDTDPPIHFLRLRVLQYLANRQEGRETVNATRRDIGKLGVSTSRVDDVLRGLAATRLAGEENGDDAAAAVAAEVHADARLIRIDGLSAGTPWKLKGESMVQLLDAGKFLVNELYVTTEYMFWSALDSSAARHAVGIHREPEPELAQSDAFRATIAARFVRTHLLRLFRSEHPYLDGLTEEWPHERARKRLKMYEDLFGFEPGRWFISDCCKSMRNFIPGSDPGGEFTEAKRIIADAERRGSMLDAIMDEPRRSAGRNL